MEQFGEIYTVKTIKVNIKSNGGLAKAHPDEKQERFSDLLR